MNGFDTRWRRLALRARGAAVRSEEAAPGFAARVLARAWQFGPTPSARLWEHLMPRFLAGAVAALVVCAVVEGPHLGGGRPLDLAIENTMGDLVWTP